MSENLLRVEYVTNADHSKEKHIMPRDTKKWAGIEAGKAATHISKARIEVLSIQESIRIENW
jgi:hypothetical protein